jgi:uroporphyrinogen decarboxylase
LRRYAAEFKGKRFLYTGVGAASANLLDMYLGTAEAMMAAMSDPGLCRAIIDRHFEQLKERILAVKALGADGIVTGDACASCSFFSPRIYRELFFPAHRRAVQFIHAQGLAAVLHICGKVGPILESMAETGADIIEGLDPPSAGGDIALRDAKRRIGARVCLKGNIDAVHVIRPGPAEQVYRACREALDEAGPGGYILSTEQITRDTPIEHVLAMLQARDDMTVKTARRD